MILPESDEVFVPQKPDASGKERPVSGFACLSFDLKDLILARKNLSLLTDIDVPIRED